MKQPISHKFNEENGARFADFNGWQMPTFYTSIIEEHKATRENIGLFDVSHMGRWWILGKDAQSFLNNLVTNDVEKLKKGRGLYTCMLNEQGGIIDDLIIYKIHDEKFLLVNNAGNHAKDAEWYKKQAQGYEVDLFDLTPSWGQIAIQGPNAKAAVEELIGLDESLKYFQYKELMYEDNLIIVAATGYTGEKGYELYGPPELLMGAWQDLIKKNKAQACGLGSRDLLRLEAGYCLHGNDIDENTTPYEAGLEWVVKLDTDFIGKDACTRKEKKLVGLAFPQGEKILARQHTKILKDGTEIGEVTSGNFSNFLNRGIAVGYIKADDQSSHLSVQIRNKEAQAQILEPWFYRNIRGKEFQLEDLQTAQS